MSGAAIPTPESQHAERASFATSWLAAPWLRRQAMVLAPLALLPLFLTAALLYGRTDAAGLLVAIAPAVFYCGYLIGAIKRLEHRFSRRQTHFEAQVAQRVDEFAPDEVRLSRHYFETRLAQEIQRSRRHRFPLCVLTLSTPIGRDRAVYTSQLVELTARVLRAEDIAGRLGRNLYAIYLPHTTPAGAGVVIERLRRALDESVQFGLAYLEAGYDALPEDLIDQAVESPVEAEAA